MRHINYASETLLEKLHETTQILLHHHTCRVIKSLICFCGLYSYHVSHIITRVQD